MICRAKNCIYNNNSTCECRSKGVNKRGVCDHFIDAPPKDLGVDALLKLKTEYMKKYSSDELIKASEDLFKNANNTGYVFCKNSILIFNEDDE